MTNDTAPVELHTFSSGLEADMAVATLTSAGIPAAARPNDIAGIFGVGFAGSTAQGVSVMVPASLAETAREILGLDDEDEAGLQ